MFKLVQKTQISRNVGRFRFALPTPTSVFGLPVGQHIICRFKQLASFDFFICPKFFILLRLISENSNARLPSNSQVLKLTLAYLTLVIGIYKYWPYAPFYWPGVKMTKGKKLPGHIPQLLWTQMLVSLN